MGRFHKPPHAFDHVCSLPQDNLHRICLWVSSGAWPPLGQAEKNSPGTMAPLHRASVVDQWPDNRASFSSPFFVMKAKLLNSGLVYSTDSGRMCPACRQPVAACQCAAAKPRAASDGIVRVSRETKGRAGKGVTLVKGLPLADAELVQLGKQLKTACGSGGTVKDGVIEVQGDHCERVMALLQAQGHKVKRAGG